MFNRLIRFVRNVSNQLRTVFVKGNLFIGRNVVLQAGKFRIEKNSVVTIEDFVRISDGFLIEARSNASLRIGKSTTFNRNLQIYGDVTIGEGCTFASEVYLSSLNHNIITHPYLPLKEADVRFPLESEGITLEDDVWVGKNVFIGPGVYVAKGSVLGANAIISHSIYRPYSIVVGTNKLLKYRFSMDSKKKTLLPIDEMKPYLYKGIKVTGSGEMSNFVVEHCGVFLIAADDGDIIEIESNNSLANCRFYSNLDVSIDSQSDSFKCDCIPERDPLSKVAAEIEMCVIKIETDQPINLKKVYCS